jgi:hypothetical protein
MRKLTRTQKAVIYRSAIDYVERIEVDVQRHRRICSVCRHPLVALIDEAFLQWVSPYTIVEQFNLPNRAVIYHHAHVFKLFDLRDRTLRRALGNIIEQSDRVKVTAQDVIRAAYAFAHINDEGLWFQPVAVTQTQVVVSPNDSSEVLSSPSGASQTPPGREEIRRVPAKPRTHRRRTLPAPPKRRNLFDQVEPEPIDPDHIDAFGLEAEPAPGEEILPRTRLGVENDAKH